ncbi:MAG TPA: hypothetical protein VHN19_16910 [Burkholderiales bacterium]|jgi:hypothetical protein|nr:hypothetical protein [Burkholderiales bacterium]
MKRELLAGIALFAGATLALAQGPVTVKLGPQNKSGESGTAKLTPEGDKTKVEISLKGAKGSQPAHVHMGSCSKLDPNPKYGLSNIEDGKSTTEIPVKLEDLMKEQTAINVHKSAAEIKTYVACGDIKQASSTSSKKSGKKG